MSTYDYQEGRGNAMAEITIVIARCGSCCSGGRPGAGVSSTSFNAGVVSNEYPERDPGDQRDHSADCDEYEVPLSAAITNLARIAVTNFMRLIQKLQSEHNQDGSLFLETKVSLPFRLTNITARAALEAMLDNHKLRLIDDPKDKR